MEVSLIIPVFNEEKSIDDTLIRAKKTLELTGKKYEIIIIDDGSSDGSAELLKKIDNVKIITNPYNLGYGASLKKGILASCGELIAITDADGTYPIERIIDLLRYTNQYDMVVGAREHDKDYFGRRPAKWILKKIASFLSGHKIPDLNSGLRVFSRNIAIEFFHLFPSGFSFTSTITLACFANDYTVKYVPVKYLSRVGESSIRPRHFFDFMGLIMKLFVYFKPLKMLMPFFFLLISLGLVKGVRDVFVEGHIGSLSLLLIIFSFQIFFMALIVEVVIKRCSSR